MAAATTTTTTTAPPKEEFINTGTGIRRVLARSSNTLPTTPTVPIIDLTDMAHPDLARRRAVAREIHDACTRVGFFYIRNHGVPDAVVESIFREMKRFFHDQSLEEKMRLHMDGNKEFYGYTDMSFEREQNYGMRTYESINLGYEPTADPLSPTPPGPSPNFWPSESTLPSFRANVESYMTTMMTLCRSLMRLFALSLSLPEPSLDHIGAAPLGAILKLNHYPGDLPAWVPEEAGQPAHTDQWFFTVLLQDDATVGLEVVGRGGGEWMPVTPIEGTFVVNVGDALSVLTNGTYLSTLHRARSYERKTRYSVPYFFGGNPDATMATLRQFVTPDTPRRFKDGFTFGEYVRMRLNRVYIKPDINFTERSALIEDWQ